MARSRLSGPVPTFKLRVPPELYETIQKHAVAADQSANAAIVAALTNAFRERDLLDHLLEDPDLRLMAFALIDTFVGGGRMQAEMDGHEDWTTAQWLADRDCYKTACRSVVAMLTGRLPAEPGDGE